MTKPTDPLILEFWDIVFDASHNLVKTRPRRWWHFWGEPAPSDAEYYRFLASLEIREILERHNTWPS